MPTLEIDGHQVTVEDGINLIQAAERLGIEIPHYCYHPALSIAGNCRMCLVEIENMPKLQIACNTRVAEGMVVRTRSERVRQAQQGVLEFLLVNHPIDCPVCDQAGECKLQDYYMDYDRQPGRVPLQFKVRKRKAVDIGRLIMLDQERCILCTRCTRFLDEVTRTHELGIFERGDRCVIDLFPGQRLDNPYSGNVVDICPVGALTNKDFRFQARVWYLDHTPSVCPSCATGCNIEIHHRRGEMFRFRPRHNPHVNGYWMCDEGRLSYRRFQGEGRLTFPARRAAEGWQRTTWDAALAEAGRLAREAGREGRLLAVVSSHATTEETYLVRRWIATGCGGTVHGWNWSPPDASHDDFLIDADKSPNRAGLRALDLPLDPQALRAAIEQVGGGVLLLWRADPWRAWGDEWIQLLSRTGATVVVADSHASPVMEAADLVLPLATFAESDGTFVNRGGRVQRVRAAFPPPAEARAGWEVALRLGGEPAGRTPAGPAAVFEEMAAQVPAFRGLSWDGLGLTGQDIRTAEGASPS